LIRCIVSDIICQYAIMFDYSCVVVSQVLKTHITYDVQTSSIQFVGQYHNMQVSLRLLFIPTNAIATAPQLSSYYLAHCVSKMQ